MMGLQQIRAINSWAKSEECKRIAQKLNRSNESGTECDAKKCRGKKHGGK